MTKSYAQLKSAIAKLEKEAAALREAETTKVVAQIKESIATFGLTVEHLFGRGAKVLKAAAGKALGGGKAARKGAGVPKYRDPKTGKTWTGFGKAPGWIATVRNRDKFLIDQSGLVAAPSVDKAVAPVAAVAKEGHPQGQHSSCTDEDAAPRQEGCSRICRGFRNQSRKASSEEGSTKEERSFEEGRGGKEGSCRPQSCKGCREGHQRGHRQGDQLASCFQDPRSAHAHERDGACADFRRT